MKKERFRKERWAVTVTSVVVVSIIIVKAKGAIVIVRQEAMKLDIVVIANVIVIVATGIEGNS